MSADTKDNIITLTGDVRSWAEHHAVVDAAWMAAGSSTSATTSKSLADRHSHRGEFDGLGSRGCLGVSVAEPLTGRSIAARFGNPAC